MWTKLEINHIKIMHKMWNCKKISNEIGRSRQKVYEKIQELDAVDRLGRMVI